MIAAEDRGRRHLDAQRRRMVAAVDLHSRGALRLLNEAIASFAVAALLTQEATPKPHALGHKIWRAIRCRNRVERRLRIRRADQKRDVGMAGPDFLIVGKAPKRP